MRRIALFFFSLLLNPSIFIKDTGLTCARSIFFKYYQSLQWAPYDNIITRFNAPRGYHQMAVGQESFACYLQHLPLKPMFSRTTTYNGDFARTDAYTSAVVAMDIGTKNLQQCAGTVIRLRAEYLFRQKKFSQIIFHFKNNFVCSYTQYANGYRYYNGQWLLKSRKNYSYAGFRRYLDLVFCNIDITSLLKDLKTVDRADSLKAGDVFIKDNSPAHCFMVMDVIENDHHIKRFLLAQGFTPAQDIQIVQYNSDEWFYLGKPCDMLYGELISKKFLRCFRD